MKYPQDTWNNKREQASEGSLSTISFFVAILLLGVFFTLKVIPKHPGLFFHDDSFFYIKTAYNISAGVGSTFDGINSTNGYHPLYMCLLSIISKFLPLVGTTGICTVFFLDMVLLAFTLAFIDIFLRYLRFEFMFRLLVAMGITCAIGFNDFGIETRLLVPLAWLLVLFSFTADLRRKTHLILLGVLGILICLTRTDAVIFVFMINTITSLRLLLHPYSLKFLQYVKKTTVILLPSVAVTLLYMLHNQLLFGYPTSISSWLKVGWPGNFATGWFANSLLGNKVRFWLCFCVAFCYFTYTIHRTIKNGSIARHFASSPSALLFTALNLFTCVFFAVLLCLSRGGVGGWYFALPLSIAIVTGISIIKSQKDGFLLPLEIPNILWRAFIVVLCVIMLITCVLFVHSKVEDFKRIRTDPLRMAKWIRENLPINSRIYQVDGTGFTGYFSERTVINGDGLINGWEYQRYLRTGNLAGYLRKNKVEYIVWNGFQGEDQIRIPVPLWNSGPKILTFSEKPDYIIQYSRYILLKPKDIDSLSLLSK